MAALKVGDPVPAVRLRADGTEVSLRDFAGRRVFLFIFVKALTPG